MSSKGKHVIPPPPADAAFVRYILVKTKHGYYWRRARGTVKEAKLNDTLTKYTQLTGVTSPAATRIRELLQPFLFKIQAGRFIARVSGALNKSYMKSGNFNFLEMFGYDFQPKKYAMGKLIKDTVDISLNGHELKIRVPRTHYGVKSLNGLVTHFFYDTIIVHGDPTKQNNIRVENETSPIFDVESTEEQYHTITTYLPARETSWMLILKISNIELKDEPACHHRHYGMKVLAVGTSGSSGARMVKAASLV